MDEMIEKVKNGYAINIYKDKMELSTAVFKFIESQIIRTLKIQDAYNKDPNLKNLIFDDWFNNEIATRLDNLSKVVSLSTKAGIPVPCLSSTLDYLNSYRTNRLPQNLVQAMRDCFGSHTYERIDKEGSFHTEWMK